MATATQLLTADEYSRLTDLDRPTELVRGEIIEMNQPVPRHGQVCLNVGACLKMFLMKHRLGHVVSNDSGILTQRDPDTVRGGDVWYISYDKVPAGPLPDGYLELPPDIVFEVQSPSDRPSRLLKKIAEYLDFGVPVVCVLDPDAETARLYFRDRAEVILGADEELTFPDQLPGFRVQVRQLFE